jgi:hypothetical protein
MKPRERPPASPPNDVQHTDGKRISGRYVVKDGMVTVTATNGRITTAEIEDSMLTPQTLAKALLFRLHRIEKSTEGE